MTDAQRDDDGVRWLALELLKVCVMLANAVRKRYGLSRGCRCPVCKHQF